MKKLALFLAFALILSCFAGCGEKEKSPQEVSSDTTASQNSEIPDWQDEAVKKAIIELKNAHKKSVSPENQDDQYLEIKNTRLISIKEDAKDDYGVFDDVKYVIEFMLLTNYHGTSPYYSYTTDSYAIYENETIKQHDAFILFRSMGYSSDFSDIIDEIYDLGGAYNEVFHLETYVPTATNTAKLPDPMPIAAGTVLEIKDEDENVLLTEADIKEVAAKYEDEQYYLVLKFTEGGAERLKTATEENVGKTLPLYVNNALVSMPTVGDVISDGVLMLNCVSDLTLLDIFEKLTQ